jgi:hypothetical protein
MIHSVAGRFDARAMGVVEEQRNCASGSIGSAIFPLMNLDRGSDGRPQGGGEALEARELREVRSAVLALFDLVQVVEIHDGIS